MDIPPVEPPATPQALTTRGEAAGAGPLPFAAGQRLFARVVQVLSEQSAIVDLAGQRLTTSTPLPVAAGQVLEVTVRSVGPLIELDLADPPVLFSEDAYALAAVLHAKTQTSPAATPVSAEERVALLQALERALVRGAQAGARATLHQRAAAALQPVALGADGSRLLEALRRAIGGSGVFLEARLAALPGRASPADLAALRDDARAILGELEAVTRNQPELEEARARLLGDVLARQIDTAYHKVKDGELRLDIPVTLGQAAAEVQLRVRDDPAGADDEAPAPGRQIDLIVELPDLGRVRTSMSWTPAHLTTRFTVDHQAQADRIAAGLDALSAHLRAVGFRDVAVAVDVDASVGREAPDVPDPLLPGGSILRVRV